MSRIKENQPWLVKYPGAKNNGELLPPLVLKGEINRITRIM